MGNLTIQVLAKDLDAFRQWINDEYTDCEDEMYLLQVECDRMVESLSAESE